MQNTTVQINVADLKAIWQREAEIALAMRILAKLPSYHQQEVWAALLPAVEPANEV